MNKKVVLQLFLRSFLAASVAILSPFTSVFATDVPTRANRSGIEAGQHRNSYALLIGVSDYSRYGPGLPWVVEDIAEIGKTLEGIGFTVVETLNPDMETLNKSLAGFINAYGQEKDNRLLVYFAGSCYHLAPRHGADEMDYLVPSDAPNPDAGIVKFRESALSLYHVEVMIEHIRSNQALFLFDGCGGKVPILGLRKEEPAKREITEKTFNLVRQVFFFEKPGSAKPGQNKNFVRKQLVRALSGEGDLNGDGFVTGSELAVYFKIRAAAEKTKFFYGAFKNPPGEMGDMVIPLHPPEKKKEELPETPAASAKNATLPPPKTDAPSVAASPPAETMVKNAADILSPMKPVEQLSDQFMSKIQPEDTSDISKHIGSFWPPGESEPSEASNINEETFKFEGTDRKNLRQMLIQMLIGEKPPPAEAQAKSVDIPIPAIPLIVGPPPTAGRPPPPEPKTKSLAAFPENKPGNRWVTKVSGTASDTKSGLMWMTQDFRNLEGRAPKSWDEALAWVEKTNAQGFAGYKDWRAPTIEELKTTYNFEANSWDPNRDKRLGYPEAFAEGGGNWYWSKDERSADEAWGFGFFSGAAKPARKKESYSFSSIRLVRSDNSPAGNPAASK